VQRGNNRHATFFAVADYRLYLDCLYEAAQKYGCLIHAYVLMTNHVHLLATPCSPQAMSRVMQHLGRCYVRYVNNTHKRTGTLWEGRFRASVVDTERYFLTCCRYIELNPVRAGIVDAPEDYRWSSYRCNALGVANRLVSHHGQYRALGTTDLERRQAYRALFRDQIDEDELRQIRLMTKEGWPLGSDPFKDAIEQLLNRVARPPKKGRPARSRDDGTSVA
jgi:putative transposase